MFFKMNGKNPFRNLVRNARRTIISDYSNEEKVLFLKSLYSELRESLKENEYYLNSQPAYSTRCIHWNYREVESIKPVKNLSNPWLRFKREFEQALTNDNFCEVVRSVSVALGWFYSNDYLDDWIVDLRKE